MKSVTNASKILTSLNVLKFKGFEKLTKFELSKVRGGNGDDYPPVTYPD